MRTALDWKKYYSSPEFLDNYIYAGNDLGVTCTDSGASFKLWSPAADRVTLNLYQDERGERRMALEHGGAAARDLL